MITGLKQRERSESAMRQDGGLQRAAVVLLQATLAMGILIGCGVVTRPADGTLDLPHFANQAPSTGMEPSPRLSVATEAIWAQ
jgi:hypothetical protein